MPRDPRRAYRVVDLFEQELAGYCGAPFAVAVNSCTNALFLALVWSLRQEHERNQLPWYEIRRSVGVPRRTYVGVMQSVLNSGYDIDWRDEPDPWQARGYYNLAPTQVWDFARHLERGCYPETLGAFACLSMHAAKQLPLGRGGAILTDNEEAAEWFLAARMDGRPPGQPLSRTVFPAWHMPMPPDVAARGLDILSRWNDAGWSPPPLPPTTYPDLSLIYPREGVTV